MLEDKNGVIKTNETVDCILMWIVKYVSLPMAPLLGIALIIVGIWFGSLGMFLYFGIPGILLLTAGMAAISDLHAKYDIRTDGLWVKYPLEPLKMISWNEFQEVCVCYAGHHNGHAHSVICCVKKGEKENVFTGRWKTMNPYKHRSVITMDYTDELYDEFKEKCPYPVKDLRNTRRYKIY